MAVITRFLLLAVAFVEVLSSDEPIDTECDHANVHFILTPVSYLPTSPHTVFQNTSVDRCVRLCKEELKCREATVDYVQQTCHLSEDISTTKPKDSTRGYYGQLTKVCLPASRKCIRSWVFESVPPTKSSSLSNERSVTGVSSREGCVQACLHQTNPLCLSVEYRQDTGKCVLNAYNRFSSPGAPSQKDDSKGGVEYLENACFPEARGFCNTKITIGRQIIAADSVLFSSSVEDCRRKCIETSSFACRSASFNRQTSTCSLSHLPLKLLPEGAYVFSKVSVLIEVVVCYEVSVDCQPDKMAVKVRTSQLFDGKVYARNRLLTCRQDVQKQREFFLPVSLTDPSCGTQRKGEGTFSNVLIIQANDHIVTIMDKAIGVQCTYGAGNITEDGNLRVWEEQSTDHKRKTPPLPDLSLRILDMQGNELNSVSLGEVLRVQVTMSDEDTYGIFLRNLVATDGTNEQNITLIDSSGCPVYTRMMREVRTITSEGKGLESYLEAFAFTGSEVLELNAEVDTCIGGCQPVQCHILTGRSDEDTETVVSYGRRKKRRRALDPSPVTIRLSRSIVVEATELTGSSFGYQGLQQNSTVDGQSRQGVEQPGDPERPGDAEFCLESRKTSFLIGILVSFNSLLFTFILILWCRVYHCENRERHLSVYYTNANMRPDSDVTKVPE